VFVTVVAIVVAGVGLVQALVVGDDGTPRTAAERAIASAEEAVRANPDDAVARVRLAAAYLEQGSPSKAAEQAAIALRLNPAMPDAHFVLGVASFRQGDNQAAVASLNSAAEAEGQFAPFYQEVYVALARAYEAVDDTDSAIQSYEDALAYGPENAAIVVERGQMFEREEEWYEAAYDYGYALIFIPDYQEAIDGLARIEQGHPEEYAQAMENVDSLRAEVNPHSGGAAPGDTGSDEE
jgi:tetratricopeptide (TPR) repeat protein